MNNRRKLFEKLMIRSGMVNILAGIALAIALIIIFVKPNNQFAILTACTAGGVLNVMLGINMRKDPKKRMTAMSYVFMGIILIGLGFYLIQLI